jgi:hypothetical protein
VILELLDLEAFRLQHREQAIRTDEVCGADDY